MMLVAKAGYTRGAYWPVAEQELLIGRSNECTIVIPEPIVSRRHCRLTPTGHGVAIECLSEGNPVLLNGQPAREGQLLLGDELSIGSAVFILAEEHAVAECPSATPDEETKPLMEPRVSFFEEGNRGTLITSQEDSILLFQFSRDLSLCDSTADLQNAVKKFLRYRFDAVNAWVIAENDHAAPAAPPWVLSCAGEARRAGALRRVTEKKLEAPLMGVAAPLACAGLPIGAVVMQGHAGGSLTHSDTICFGAMAEILGPFVHALERRELLTALNRRLSQHERSHIPLVGKSQAIHRLRQNIEAAADTPMSVLLSGETGTGKELVARAIHALSARSLGPFVAINCAAVPDDLFESEMFGHTRGAFTGAAAARLGLLQKADGGTLFLDEVGDLSGENQASLLRVLEDGTYRPVGSDVERRADLRVIAAANRPLLDSGFREDLYHRLGGFIIEIPPLRERTEDIPLLAQHFLDQLAARNAEHLRALADDALERLQSHHWPGNVRELRNCIERAAFSAETNTIHAAAIEEILGAANSRPDARPVLSLKDMEHQHIETVVRAHAGNMTKAAEALGIGRSTLYLKVKQYNISV